MNSTCTLCHNPILPDQRTHEIHRRVERRAAYSGRVRGYSVIKSLAHMDCSRTPEAKAERIANTKRALEMAGVTGERADEVMRSVE